MRRASQSQSQSPVRSRRRGRPLGEGSPGLADLAGRFERFRRERGRGARVPEDLRAAALAELRSGVAPGALYRTCGVSWSQVAAWKASGMAVSTQPRSQSPAVGDVRVFSVVDEPVREEEVASESQALELRIGRWSVSVRLADFGARQASVGRQCYR
jgi:hypothetical protein